MAIQEKHMIGGIEWTATFMCHTGEISFSAEMSEADYAARAELWSMAKARGFAVEPWRHEDDADIVDPGNVWVLMRAPKDIAEEGLST